MAICGLTAVLRFHTLFRFTFHPDEALFATWARTIATGRDPLLLAQNVDKPPLLFYLQAAFYPLQGPVEWAARLPNFLAFLALIPLSAQWARRLYHDEAVAILTALFLALSPMAIQFSPTAFTDPLLVALLVAGAVAATSRQPRWTAVCFGLALLTKHQAWLFLPLLVGLALSARWAWVDWRVVGQTLLPFVALLLLWDARDGRFDLWASQWDNYGGLRPIWSWELWPRGAAWGALGQTLFGSLGLTWLFAGLTALLAGRALVRSRGAVADLLLILWGSGYVLLHWFLAIPIWDRYLLPLLPLTAVLLAREISLVMCMVGRGRRTAVWLGGFALVLAMLPSASRAWQATFPVGGQITADEGAQAVAALLTDAPYGTVLYDHWYSWQWGYLFFDSTVYVNWFPDPDTLLEDLAVFGRDGHLRYIALPPTAVAEPVRQALLQAGWQLDPLNPNESSIVLYQIRP